MVRPLTDRTAAMAKLDTKLPSGFLDAIQQLLVIRNQHPEEGRGRLYARDLHQEAIAEILHRADAGEAILFLAPPSARPRRTMWVDDHLKVGVEKLAKQYQVTQAAVVMTALHRYLGRWKMLEPALAA